MNFTKWRELHKVTVDGLAKKAGTSINSIMKYERGTELRNSTLKKIEKAISEIDGGLFVNQKKDYSPKSINVDDVWSYIPKEFNYIAKDFSGDIYLHKTEPSIKYQDKAWTSESCSKLPLNIQFDSLEWKECMVKRPFNYWDYVGKIGIFYDKNNDMQIIGKLESINLDSDSPFKRSNGFSYKNFRPLTEQERLELA